MNTILWSGIHAVANLFKVAMASRKWLATLLMLPGVVLASPPVVLPGTLTLSPYGTLPGGLSGWTYSYSEPGWETVVTGLIMKPTGTGPFPVVVTAHGKGGNAVGFGSQKSQEWFGPAGYMTISMELTHAGEVLCMDSANQCGGSPENVRRGSTAVSIIKSQALIDAIGDVVDRDFIYLYGNSLGATTALELAEDLSGQFRAVALTAGGVVKRSKLAYMTPSGSNGVADIGAPVMQMHGRLDGVIKTDEAQALDSALSLYDKVHQMVWFPNGGHNIATAQGSKTQVGNFILGWFAAYDQQAVPRIDTISPTSGGLGTPVTLSGTNFGTNPGNNSVASFSGVPATATAWSNSAVTVTVPSGAATGAVQVVVPVGPVTDKAIEKPVGGGMRSNRLIFTVN